jgi:hypothetical protein
VLFILVHQLIMKKLTHNGFVTTATLFAIVKDVPAVRAVIVNPPTRVATVELQVTLNFIPSVSSVITKIWLFAVTAEVFTTIELETAFVGRFTLPAAADPQAAGDAEELQFVAVRCVAPDIAPAAVTDVAAATPKVGVTIVQDVVMQRLPVPDCAVVERTPVPPRFKLVPVAAPRIGVTRVGEVA